MLIYLGCFLGHPWACLTGAKDAKDFFSCDAFVKNARGASLSNVSAKSASIPDDYVFIPGNCIGARLFDIN